MDELIAPSSPVASVDSSQQPKTCKHKHERQYQSPVINERPWRRPPSAEDFARRHERAYGPDEQAEHCQPEFHFRFSVAA